MGGIFRAPKAPPPPPAVVDETLSRREAAAAANKKRESKRFAARSRARRGSQSILMDESRIGNQQGNQGNQNNQGGQSTLGPSVRNPRG
tara:strand:+ start:1007 stop:1273 length:267 start_codon:yes stop_codon:yes gene_type:complete